MPPILRETAHDSKFPTKNPEEPTKNIEHMPESRAIEIMFGVGAYGAILFIFGLVLIVLLIEKEPPNPALAPETKLVDLIDKIMRQILGLAIGFFVLMFIVGMIIGPKPPG